MMRWSAKRFFLVVLAFLVTASMGVSAVQAATFIQEPAKMSMMVGMDNPGDYGCKHCIGDMSGKAMACAPACVAIVVSNQTVATPQVHQLDLFFTTLDRWLKGQSPVPIPYPPRTTHIG